MTFYNYLIYIFLTIIEFTNSDLLFSLIYEIIALGAIISLANRASDKILKGLQGTASATVIGRGVYDAYKTMTEEGGGSEDKDDSEKTKDKTEDKKDDVKNDENKEKDNNIPNEK